MFDVRITVLLKNYLQHKSELVAGHGHVAIWQPLFYISTLMSQDAYSVGARQGKRFEMQLKEMVLHSHFKILPILHKKSGSTKKGIKRLLIFRDN
jgi:hypothetical protein